MGACGLPPNGWLNTRGFCTGEMKRQIHSDRAATGSRQSGADLTARIAPQGTLSPGSGSEVARLFGSRGIFNCVELIISHIPPTEPARRFGSCPRPRNWQGWRQEGAIKPLPRVCCCCCFFFSHRELARSALGKRLRWARSG